MHGHKSLKFFTGLDWPGGEVNHPRPSSTEVKNEWRYTSASPIRLRVMDRENIYLYLEVERKQKFSASSLALLADFSLAKVCLPSGKKFRRVSD